MRNAGPNRTWLHLLLLVATFYTMTLAGAFSATGRLEPFSPDFLRQGLSYSLCVLAILGSHEMGHYIACRWYGVSASLPYFLPSFPFPMGTFGAFIRIREPFPNRNVLFDVGVAGPLAGFIVMLPVLVYGLATARPEPLPTEGLFYYSDDPLLFTWLAGLLGPRIPDGYTFALAGPLQAAWVGCLATALNLFPIGQLDGGHLCYAISTRFHRLASIAGIAGFIVIGLLVSHNWLFLATLLLFFGPKHPPLIDETGRLSRGRKVLAAIALLILIACFIPRPISVVEP